MADRGVERRNIKKLSINILQICNGFVPLTSKRFI